MKVPTAAKPHLEEFVTSTTWLSSSSYSFELPLDKLRRSDYRENLHRYEYSTKALKKSNPVRGPTCPPGMVGSRSLKEGRLTSNGIKVLFHSDFKIS